MSKQYVRIPGLMDESPISFYPYLAKVLGVNEAIVLQQIWFWINSNRNKKSTYHFREGKWWVYNSYKQWCEDEFIWLKPRGLQGIILNLESKGILLSMQGVPNKHDRRKWYSIDLKVLENLLEAHLGHSAENVPYSADDALSIDDNMHHVDVHEMHDEYTEIEKTTKKTTEILLPTANAVAESAAHSHNIVAQDESELSARAESSVSVEAHTDAKSTDTTTPLSPSSAAPLSPAEMVGFTHWRKQAYPGTRLPKGAILERWHAEFRADPHYQQWMDEETRQDGVQRSAKQLANDARIEALRVAMFKGRKLPDVPLEGREISNYGMIATELIKGGIPEDQFLAYVEYWNKAAEGWPGGLTLNSLIKPGRMTDFKGWYQKQPKKAQISTSESTQVHSSVNASKRGYDPRSDPAYAYLYDKPEERNQAK